MDNEKFLLIKLKELPLSKEGLKERASGNWGISQEKLVNVEYVIVSYKTEIVAVYKLNTIFESDELWGKKNKNRLKFDFEETDKFSELKSKKIISRTSNPVSTLLGSDLVFK